MPHLLDKKNVDMLTAHKVFTVPELESRCEIMLENYCKTVVIEANTMADMVRKDILPAVAGYTSEMAGALATKKSVVPEACCGYEKGIIVKLSVLMDQISGSVDELEDVVASLADAAGTTEEAYMIRDRLLPKMQQLRAVVDEAETLTAEKYWPYPTYGKLLFGVR